MPNGSAQSKRYSYSNHLLGSVNGVQEILSEYLENEKDKTALFRLAIVNYELGSLGRMLVYRHVSPKSARCGCKEDLRTDIGDALINLIILSQILGISSGEALCEAIDRLENKEWRKH